MPAKRKSPKLSVLQLEEQAAKELKAQAVFVSNPAEVVSLCKAAIMRVTKLDFAEFEPIGPAQRPHNYMRLRGTGATEATSGKRRYLVVPFFTMDHVRYWLGAFLEFQSAPGFKEAFLTNVGLVVFEGSLAFEDEKRALLRVEWQCNEGYLTSKHAQPHWHVYSSLLNQELATRDEAKFDDEPLIQEFTADSEAKVLEFFDGGDAREAEWRGGDKFHFALSAPWQVPRTNKESQPLNVVLIPDQLGNWMEWCLSYIKHQLEYIAHKLGYTE